MVLKYKYASKTINTLNHIKIYIVIIISKKKKITVISGIDFNIPYPDSS